MCIRYSALEGFLLCRIKNHWSFQADILPCKVVTVVIICYIHISMCFRLRRHSHSVRRYIFVIKFKEKSLFLDNLCMNVMKSLDFPGICGISQKHKFLACYSVHSQKNYYIMRYLYISPHKITMIKYTCGSTLLGSIVLIHFSMFRKKLKTKVIVFFSQSRTTTPYGAFVETPASSTTSSSSC